MAVHNRIALFRAERGVSRKELAEAVGVNNQTIGYLERGDYMPSLELALKIARYFDVSIEMLFSLQAFESIAMMLKRAGEEK
ncbi:MAG: helix-turn-helix transcriptional regulator [Burkholderiaceae bacterium]|nr:helix-turn-helix transcriptional regulator [Burkholderiaceae bacterium]